MSSPDEKPIDDDAFDFSNMFGENNDVPSFDAPGSATPPPFDVPEGEAGDPFGSPPPFGDSPFGDAVFPDAVAQESPVAPFDGDAVLGGDAAGTGDAGLFGGADEAGGFEGIDAGVTFPAFDGGEEDAGEDQTGPLVSDDPKSKKNKKEKKGKKNKKEGKGEKKKKPDKETPGDPNKPGLQASDILYPLVTAILGVLLILGAVFSFHEAAMMTQILFYGAYGICGVLMILVPLLLWKAKMKKGFYDVILGVALEAVSLSVILLLICAYAYDFTIKP